MVGILESRNLSDPVDLKVRIEQKRQTYVKFYFSEDIGKGKAGGISYQLAYIGYCVVKMRSQVFKGDCAVIVLYICKYFNDLLTFGYLYCGDIVGMMLQRIYVSDERQEQILFEYFGILFGIECLVYKSVCHIIYIRIGYSFEKYVCGCGLTPYSVCKKTGEHTVIF